MKYDFQAIEKKWQARWETEKPFAAVTGDPRPKFYGLIEFPYPSGAGLHVGHPRSYTAMDIIARPPLACRTTDVDPALHPTKQQCWLDRPAR